MWLHQGQGEEHTEPLKYGLCHFVFFEAKMYVADFSEFWSILNFFQSSCILELSVKILFFYPVFKDYIKPCNLEIKNVFILTD